MKIKPAYLIAVGLALLILLWFIYGTEIRNNGDDTAPAPTAVSTEHALPSVVARRIRVEQHASYLNLHGRSEAVREVAVKAETAGLVVRTPVKEGQYVQRGALLCQQDVDARQAQLDQAKAILRSRELDYNAAKTLVDKGFRSETQALSALAALDGARASVKQAEIEIGNVNMRAPFAGIFDQQIAEIGEYLSPGQACGLLVDLDPMLIVGEATEKQIGSIKVGQPAEIELATGESLVGKVRFIESKANPQTRTFKLEVEVLNKKNLLKSGVTASLKLSSGQTESHFIPSRVLTLDDQGRIGVRYIDDRKTVRFSTVTTIDENEDGMWVTGLPDVTDLIIVGQDYVAEGSTVDVSYEGSSGQSSENINVSGTE
jgi:multidrug efflux system membrane fusion protein